MSNLIEWIDISQFFFYNVTIIMKKTLMQIRLHWGLFYFILFENLLVVFI